jgi:hypothetical protein
VYWYVFFLAGWLKVKDDFGSVSSAILYRSGCQTFSNEGQQGRDYTLEWALY